MRIRSAVIMLFLLTVLTTACSADSPDRFQSVSGEFAKNWITSYKAQNPEPIKKINDNGSDYGIGVWPPREARLRMES